MILPGGFAHGDYLRTGAMARFSPIMREVQAFAERGGPVLGICNGFQILLEAGLLPGAMLRNREPEVPLRARPRARRADRHAVHARRAAGPGAADSDRARRGQLLRAARRARSGSRRTARSSSATPTPTGELDDDGEPERLGERIAGICNEARNVVGLMPHPERACESLLGSADGLRDLRVGRRSRSAGRAGRPRDAAMIDAAGSRTPRPEAATSTSASSAFLGREPNLTELGIFSVMWSEHCSYKSSRVHLKTLPTDGPAGAAGARRERRRRRHRRRARRGLQDRVAQPSVVHRAVPGRGDRRRRHHPRHLHDGRAADRAAELAAVRIARRAAARAACSKASSPASPATATASAFRRSAARSRSSRAYAGNPLVNVFCLGIAQGVRHHQGRRVRRRQPGLLRRREDRPRRHPRRDDGVGGVRREVGGEAAGGAGRRSVHGEAAARGLPRGDEDRRARRHPGHGRRRPDLLDVRDGIARRRRRRDRRRRSCRSARPA